MAKPSGGRGNAHPLTCACPSSRPLVWKSTSHLLSWAVPGGGWPGQLHFRGAAAQGLPPTPLASQRPLLLLPWRVGATGDLPVPCFPVWEDQGLERSQKKCLGRRSPPGGFRRHLFFAGKRRRLPEGGWRASLADSALPDAPAQPCPVTLESLQRSLEDLRISVLRNCKSGSPFCDHPLSSPTSGCVWPAPFPGPLPLCSPQPHLTLPGCLLPQWEPCTGRWRPWRRGSTRWSAGGQRQRGASSCRSCRLVSPPTPPFRVQNAPFSGRLLLRFTF